MNVRELNSLCDRYKTEATGLTSEEAQKRYGQYGPNILQAKKKQSVILKFLEQFMDLMVIILILAAILAYAGGEYADASVILFIVVLNAIIGFIQEFRAEKAIEALKKLVAPQARVLRNNVEMLIEARLVVPGDVLIINEGDQIPADAILLKVNELEVLESALTGESDPVIKLTHDIKETNGTPSEIENMIFMGTSVTHGNGRAIVVKTGMDTEMGKIALLTTETKKSESPLEKELFRIGAVVGYISLGISAILFAIGFFLQGKQFIDTLLFASSVAVAAVPEGLPATITIALAIGVQRLARQNAIMKQLSSVETLGSTTVICSDKTGTLTRNEMTVREVHFGPYKAEIQGVGYAPMGEIKFGKNMRAHDSNPTEESIRLLMSVASLCNNAQLVNVDNEWKVIGDPTEGALLTMAAKFGSEYGFSKEQFDYEHERIHEIPFDSTRKRMTVIVKNRAGKYFAFTKGAPDSVIEICDATAAEKIKHLIQGDEMAKKALRCLAFAWRELSENEVNQLTKTEFRKNNIENKLKFIGLVGMMDPPRPEVKKAVELAQRAHIRIYVITGDHAYTAEAIGKQIGIISSKRKHEIIKGDRLNKMSDKELKKLLSDKNLDIIFARISPEHKLRIVNLLKELGEIVAVTGDGVNDAPALKKADIGIAMGITGTDVSKEASNMVLADDSFSTIVTAIKEGRTIYDNLKKFVFYVFSSNIGELVTIFTAIILNIPAPLTALLILCINLGTDVLPAVALGVDPSEPAIMERHPHDPQKRIINRKFGMRFAYIGIVIGLTVMAVYIFTLYRYGWTWGKSLDSKDFIFLKASSTAFATLILIQMANAFNSRSEKLSIFRLGIFSNMWLIIAITISIFMTFILIESPILQPYLHTTSLDLTDWGVILTGSVLILFIEEIRKLINARRIA